MKIERFNLSLDEKLNLIESSKSLDDLSIKAMPDVVEDDFYFISYSHRDYKRVYKDLLLLEEYGIKIWYDRGMVPGKDWSEKAEEILSKFHCRGIIFYLSDNSLKSDAIYEEVKIVQKWNKPFFSINFEINGIAKNVKEMLEFYDIKSKNNKTLCTFFNQKNIFLGLEAETSKKIEKIKLFEQIPEFEYKDDRDSIKLIHLNNKELTKFDRKNLPNEKCNVVLSEALFSNVKSLHSLDLNGINYGNNIPRYCFYGCEGLNDINIPIGLSLNDDCVYSEITLGDSAFENSGIKNIDFLFTNSSIEDIENIKKYKNAKLARFVSFKLNFGKRVFAGCKYISSLYIHEQNLIGRNYDIIVIEEEMFADCINLTSLTIESSTVVRIEKKAFANCVKLKKLKIIANEIGISDDSFLGCINLNIIELKYYDDKRGKPVVWHNMHSYLLRTEGDAIIDELGGLVFINQGKRGKYIVPNSVKEIDGNLKTVSFDVISFSSKFQRVIGENFLEIPNLKIIDFRNVVEIDSRNLINNSNTNYSILLPSKFKFLHARIHKESDTFPIIYLDYEYNEIESMKPRKTKDLDLNTDVKINEKDYWLINFDSFGICLFTSIFPFSISSKIFYKNEFVFDEKKNIIKPRHEYFKNNPYGNKIYKNTKKAFEFMLNNLQIDKNIKFKNGIVRANNVIELYNYLLDGYDFNSIFIDKDTFDVDMDLNTNLSSANLDEIIVGYLCYLEMESINQHRSELYYNNNNNNKLIKFYDSVADIKIKTICFEKMDIHVKNKKRINLIKEELLSSDYPNAIYAAFEAISPQDDINLQKKAFASLEKACLMGDYKSIILLADTYVGFIYDPLIGIDYSKALRLYQESLKYMHNFVIERRIELLEEMILNDFKEDVTKLKEFCQSDELGFDFNGR